MSQPTGIIQFYDAVQEIPNLPPLASDERLLPFQIRRTAGLTNPVLIFRLIDEDGTIVNLYPDKALINIYEFDGFEQLIYDVQADLSTLVPHGVYYIKIGDGINNWYSNWITVCDIPLAFLGYGEYGEEHSYEYVLESLSIDDPTGFYIMNFSNYFDLGFKISQYGFQDILVLNQNQAPINIFVDNKTEILSSQDTGKDFAGAIYYYNEWTFSFLCNENVSKFVGLINTFDFVKIVTPDGTEIKIDAGTSKFETEETDRAGVFEVIITYRTDYQNANNCTQTFSEL